jgi:hypothetical protein
VTVAAIACGRVPSLALWQHANHLRQHVGWFLECLDQVAFLQPALILGPDLQRADSPA